MQARNTFDAFLAMMEDVKKEKDYTKEKIKMPKLEKEDLETMLYNVIQIFQNEHTLLRISGNYNIVGDLHGNIRDLLRIFSFTGSAMNFGYIFLGDYVDRGDFSIEICILVFALKLLYPSKVYVLRGNHEFESVNTMYGFKAQVIAEYDEDIYNLFNEAFSWMPLAGILNDNIFLVHGGICPALKKVSQIDELQRPITRFDNDLVVSLENENPPPVLDSREPTLIEGMMWSDPCEDTQWFKDSLRGKGDFYGSSAVKYFLNLNNLRCIIRGHECVNGIRRHLNHQVITVFSSSLYSQSPSNSAGLLQVMADGEMHSHLFEPIEQYTKAICEYKKVEMYTYVPLCQRKIYAPLSRSNLSLNRLVHDNKTQNFRKSIIKLVKC